MAQYQGRDVKIVETLLDNPEKAVVTYKDDITRYTVNLTELDLTEEEEKAIAEQLQKDIDFKKKSRAERKAARKAERQAWNSSQTYAKDAKVSYEGWYYASTRDGNIGSVPSATSKDWTKGAEVTAPVVKNV